MNRNFTQAMSVRCSDTEKMERVIELRRQWDHDQAQADIMGSWASGCSPTARRPTSI